MIDYKHLLIAIITGSIGAFARIFYEIDQNKNISISRMFSIFIASVVVSYGAYEGTLYWGGKKIIGIISIVGGMISVDIINIIINKLPNALKQIPQILLELLKFKLGIKEDKK